MVAQRHSELELLSIIASGSQGSVYLATDKTTTRHKKLALKKIYLSVDESHQREEHDILQGFYSTRPILAHPNILFRYGTQLCPAKTLVDHTTFDILMEYCPGGTLHSAIKKGVTLDVIKKWTKNLLSGLDYLHAQKIVHRDVRGDNIFLSHNDVNQAILKIGDLGASKQLLNNVTRRGEVSHTTAAVPFMSPEMIQSCSRNVHVGRKTDIWRLGCVVIQMVTGKVPQFKRSLSNGTAIPLQGTSPVMNFTAGGGLPDIPESLPNELECFIRSCLQSDPEQRPRCDSLLRHPFLVGDPISAIIAG